MKTLLFDAVINTRIKRRREREREKKSDRMKRRTRAAFNPFYLLRMPLQSIRAFNILFFFFLYVVIAFFFINRIVVYILICVCCAFEIYLISLFCVRVRFFVRYSFFIMIKLFSDENGNVFIMLKEILFIYFIYIY